MLDTFTGASGTDLALHVPDSGGTWTKHPSYTTGQIVITNAGRVRSNVTGLQTVYYQSNVSQTADYDVSADFVFISNIGTDSPGVVGRVSTSSKTFYLARYDGVTGFQLFKCVAGTFTQLGTTYAHAMSGGEIRRITLRMIGTSISLLVDGVVQVGAVTDSDISAAGFAGIFTNTSVVTTDTSGTHLDNYDFPSMTPPPPPPPPPPPSPLWVDRTGITIPDISGPINLATLSTIPTLTGTYKSLIITADSTAGQTIGLVVVLWDERGNPISVGSGMLTFSSWAKNAAGNYIPANGFGLNPPGFLNVDVSMAASYTVLVQSMVNATTVNLHWKLF